MAHFFCQIQWLWLVLTNVIASFELMHLDSNCRYYSSQLSLFFPRAFCEKADFVFRLGSIVISFDGGLWIHRAGTIAGWKPCTTLSRSFFFSVWGCGWAMKMGNMLAGWKTIEDQDQIYKNISGSDWGINKAKNWNLLGKNLEPLWKGLNMWQFSQSITGTGGDWYLHPKTTDRCKHWRWFGSQAKRCRKDSNAEEILVWQSLCTLNYPQLRSEL